MCLPIFLDRLKNEITRLTTVKALTKIAASPLRIDLRPVMVIFLYFMRVNDRFQDLDICSKNYKFGSHGHSV